VSTHNEDEARLNRKMCEVAERIIVVTDSSKFNRSSLHKIIDTQRIDMIIVDEGIPAESLEGLRKSGIDVVLVSPHLTLSPGEGRCGWEYESRHRCRVKHRQLIM
jgi:DeoR family transcriptional regulator of aga operon